MSKAAMFNVLKSSKSKSLATMHAENNDATRLTFDTHLVPNMLVKFKSSCMIKLAQEARSWCGEADTE